MLLDILADSRDSLLEGWRQAIFETYPSDSISFLNDQKDQFQNPVGHAVKLSTATLIDQLLGPMDTEQISEAVDRIVRIRAVQTFTPGEAVGFVALLKPLIRQAAMDEGIDPSGYRELIKIEDRIDAIQMAAFDHYSVCRDQLAQARVNETKRSHSELLRRLNASPDTPGETN